MAKQIRKKTFNKEGFTLIEVMIALAIFGVFIVSFMAAQGYNVTDSTSLRREIRLKQFVQEKINELVTTPPELKDSLTLRSETGKFESDESMKFEVTYMKFKIPDFDKIKGKQKQDEQEETDPLQKKIFEMVKKNMEEIVWQVQVKVTDTNTGYSQIASTWLNNDKAPVKLDAL